MSDDMLVQYLDAKALGLLDRIRAAAAVAEAKLDGAYFCLNWGSWLSYQDNRP